ncbi:MAG: hypothetical protein ACRDIF_01730 [Actinomycetota bacterium]
MPRGWRAFAFVAVVAAIAALIPLQVAWAQAPGPAPSPGGAAPIPEVQADRGEPPVWDVVGRARHAINAWLSELVASALDPVFRLLGASVFSTPRLDRHPRIAELWRFSLGIADAALVLMVLAGSGIVMAGGGLASQVTAKELLPGCWWPPGPPT